MTRRSRARCSRWRGRPRSSRAVGEELRAARRGRPLRRVVGRRRRASRSLGHWADAVIRRGSRGTIAAPWRLSPTANGEPVADARSRRPYLLSPMPLKTAGAAARERRRALSRSTSSGWRSASTSRSCCARCSSTRRRPLVAALGPPPRVAAVPDPGHRARLPAGRALRAARARGRRARRARRIDPRGVDRPRVRARHRLRLHDDRAESRPRGVTCALAIGLLRAAYELLAARAAARGRHSSQGVLVGEATQPRASCARRSGATAAASATSSSGVAASSGLRRSESSRARDRGSPPDETDPRRGTTSTTRRCSRSSSARIAAACKVRLAPRTTELLVQSGEYVPGQGVPLFELRPPILAGMGLGAKRAFDLVVSAR